MDLDAMASVTNDKFVVDELSMSVSLVMINLALVLITLNSTQQRAKHAVEEGMLNTIYDIINQEEDVDKERNDKVYQKYVGAAPEGAERIMLANLDALRLQTLAQWEADEGPMVNGQPDIAQPDAYDEVGVLIAASESYNDAAHSKLRAIVEACGGEYKAGPIKIAERIKAKAENDYDGSVKKVVDTVRGSGMLHRYFCIRWDDSSHQLQL